jgi:hypothetical protein
MINKLEVVIKVINKLSIKLILMSISISFTTSAAADKNYFSIEGSNNNIIVGVVSEDLNDKIAEFPYQGLSDSTNAMVSFYYLSKIKDLKGIIDIIMKGMELNDTLRSFYSIAQILFQGQRI